MMSYCRVLSTALLASLLAGCAGNAQVAPKEERGGPMSLAKPFESGTVAGDVYSPSAAEKALDCRKLKGSMIIIIARLKDAANRPKPSATSAAIQSGVSTVKGQPNTMDLDAELKRERTRLKAYNGLLVEKKCPPMDIAKELAAKG
jgi:hypothetical protein